MESYFCKKQQSDSPIEYIKWGLLLNDATQLFVGGILYFSCLFVNTTLYSLFSEFYYFFMLTYLRKQENLKNMVSIPQYCELRMDISLSNGCVDKLP